jgi:hypothetical protein
MIYHITFIHTWAAIFFTTSQMGPSQPHSGERLTPPPHGGYVGPLVRLALVSIINKLFVLTVHASGIQPPPFTTITQVLTHLCMLTSWVCDTTYKYIRIHKLQSFFLFFYLTFKQVSWPRTLMSGTVHTHQKYVKYSYKYKCSTNLVYIST